MKSSLVFIFLVAAFISCRKTSVVADRSPFEKEVYQALAEKMSPADFSALDWKRVKVEKVKGQPGLLKIKHKYDSRKVLLFGRMDGTDHVNWVEVNKGSVILSDLQNHVLGQINIGEKHLITQRTNDDPGDLPPFTVIGYTNSNDEPSAWWSLYWLFNGNMLWFNKYTQNDLLDPSCTTCFGGDEVLPLEELYPETPEILLFEHDYLGSMSPEEAQIYHSMSRSLQLRYLWSATKASLAAQAAYPAPYHNGKADAYRHAYFNALNSKLLGIELATALANAHENIPNNPPLEREMDLRNNQAGRNAFLWLNQLYPGLHFFEAGLSLKLHEMMQNGQLWYLSPVGANGAIIPTTQLIPSNQ
jgi:hypothetical protein